MNFKEWLIPLSLVLVVSFAFHLFFSRRTQPAESTEVVAGQMFEVQHTPEIVTPLNWQINFAETDEQTPQVITVKTMYGELTFSSAGAALERMLFKHGKYLLTPIDIKEPSQKIFLLALSEKTPYRYTFMGQQEDEKNVTLRYEYQLADATLIKVFTINKQVPQIDLVVQLQAKAKFDAAKKMRIFYLSPIAATSQTSEITAFVNDMRNAQNLKKPMYKFDEIAHKTWHKPTIFGVADKFFVHAMVADHNGLIYRSALNAVNNDKDLLAQLEANDITGSGQWQLTFYLGPKQLSLMSAVDDRLEQVLDYGFWSSLSKIILKILNFLYGYVKNYGLAIILFTLLFQLLLMPLSISSQKSIEKQADLNRKIQYLKQKYRNDSERLQQEQAELLRTHGVGGLMGGCLLVLVQAPIFLALSRLLSNCFELYNERFLWIPDLASYDPFYILPLLFFIAMLARTYTQDKPIRQQLSMYALTLFFAAMMARLSAGLVLYIFTGVLVNVIQVYLMKFKRA